MDESIETFDIAVIGSGPGGYPAAIKAAQLGASVALIEAKELGGTCLNRGCIPSKALIQNAAVYSDVMKASKYGIHVGDVSIDYASMAQRKEEVVTGIRNSLRGLIESNGIKIIQGYGRLSSPREIKVKGETNRIVRANKIILATGSEPRVIPAFPCDHRWIHDSTSILELKRLPQSLIVIGGGVIGCEFASMFSSLGVPVTIVELLDSILPMESKGVSQALAKIFEGKGIKIHTHSNVQGIDVQNEGVIVRLADSEPLSAEMALVSVGRQMNTTDVGLDKAGVYVREDGIVEVNERMETSVDGIYAIGDISSKWWLAHVATRQGEVAAINAMGGDAVMHYNAIPSVTYTNPEVATVGLSLEKALEKGYKAESAAFPFHVLGKSLAALHTEGYAAIVLDKETGQILGAEVVGYEASTLIAEMTVAIANELTIDCIAETIHAHPTISEAWFEAASIGTGYPLHMPPKKKKLP